MADVKISDVVGDIMAQRYNPTAVMLKCLSAVEKAMDGSLNLVDATNPFISSIEAGVCSTVAFLQENAINTRRLYPAMAQSQSDLYRHMSDVDYVDRFALPTQATFYLFVSKTEVLNLAVAVPGTNYSKLVIPRNTEFQVSEVAFSIQHPIEIRVFDHGGFQVVHDTSVDSPLLSLPTNLIEWGITSAAFEGELLYFQIPTHQFYIDTIFSTITPSNGHKVEIDTLDQFYYIRCYLQNDSGQWVEMKTTHSDQVYDINTPTAVIDVREKKVVVIIPPVYTTTSLVNGKLRLDVYQTKGVLNMELSNYLGDDFVVDWKAIDKNDENEYVSAFRSLPTFTVISTTSVSGGRAALDFETLKSRVINNAVGGQLLPITNAQMSSSVQDLGYEIVKNVDTVTNRVFLASKPMPNPTTDQILTPASSAMVQVATTLKELEYAYGAYVNTDMVTLTSKTLYLTSEGVTKPITRAHMEDLNAMAILQRCNVITQNRYYYSPFTYVLDATGANFAFRAYHVDSPVPVRKNFIAENPTTGFQAAVAANYSIEKTATGYTIRVLTDSNIAYKALSDLEVSAQLVIHPESQDTPVYVPGVLMYKNDGSERIYEFYITTNWLIDSNHNLEIGGVYNSTQATSVRIALLQDFEVYFTTNAQLSSYYRNSALDVEIFTAHLPEGSVAISHERLRFNLGHHLQGLWSQARSALSSIIYKVYPNDVPAYYSQDTYAVDPTTGLSFTVDDQGKLVYTKIASKGDPKLTVDGQVVYEHLRGEQLLDAQGLPIPIDGYERYLNRYLDIFMIEGVYYFATDSLSATYKQQITDAMLNWILKDMPSYDGYLLDQTKIYFYPRVTAGQILLIAANNEYSTIDSEQRLKVKLFVSPTVHADNALRKALTQSTIRTLAQKLDAVSISVSAIEYALRDVYKGNVLDVEITGFAGTSNLSQMTLVQKHSRMSLRKKLTALADNTMIVEEHIDIEFIKHGSGV